MESIVLHPGADCEARARAESALAEYVSGFGAVAERTLREQRDFLRACDPVRILRTATPPARDQDLVDVQRAIRHLMHVQRSPLALAHRELNELLLLLERIPGERLTISSQGVFMALRSLDLRPGEAPASLDICLAPPMSPHFPVFVRKHRGDGEDVVFISVGRHGACRGEAVALVEEAMERIGLHDLMLVALVWARRNL